MAFLRPGYGYTWTEWETLWPMRYPAWSSDYSVYDDDITCSNREMAYKLAQRRANRRMKKKSMKAARAQGCKNRNQMPGAWPV